MRDWLADGFGRQFSEMADLLVFEAFFQRPASLHSRDRTRPPDRESTFAQQAGWEMPADRRPQPEREHGIDR